MMNDAASSEARGELPDLRRRLLAGMLRHAPFDGWSDKALRAAARDEGVTPEMASIAFQGGPSELAEFFNQEADRSMAEDIGLAVAAALDGGGLSVRARIALTVRTRMTRHAEEREALRALASFLALPANAGLAARLLWRTVDAMWRAIGDRSTDFNYYTKRAILAGIYGSTVLVWLDDRSEGSADSFAFLERRIDGAMTFERGKARLRRAWHGLFGRIAGLARPAVNEHPRRYPPRRPGATPSA